MLTTLPAALQQGRAEPLGALARDGGVNFAVFSQHAQRMELCIFDSEGTRELRRFDLHGPHDHQTLNSQERQLEMLEFSGGDLVVPCLVENGEYLQSGWGNPRRG